MGAHTTLNYQNHLCCRFLVTSKSMNKYFQAPHYNKHIWLRHKKQETPEVVVSTLTMRYYALGASWAFGTMRAVDTNKPETQVAESWPKSFRQPWQARRIVQGMFSKGSALHGIYLGVDGLPYHEFGAHVCTIPVLGPVWVLRHTCKDVQTFERTA